MIFIEQNSPKQMCIGWFAAICLGFRWRHNKHKLAVIVASVAWCAFWMFLGEVWGCRNCASKTLVWCGAVGVREKLLALGWGGVWVVGVGTVL